MFFQTAILATIVSIASATPLLEARNTDPNGVYPVCATSSQPFGKPFYLAVVPYGTDAAYGAGFLQSVADGQLFAGTNNGVSPTTQNCESDVKPFFFFAPSGLLYDNHGRQVEITYNVGQLQANYGGGSTTFGICSSDTTNQLTYTGINTFYTCKNGDGGSYRVYAGAQVPPYAKSNCNVIHLVATYL